MFYCIFFSFYHLGSIRVHLELIAQPEKLKSFVYSILSYVKNDGTVDIGGQVVKISSFVHEEIKGILQLR